MQLPYCILFTVAYLASVVLSCLNAVTSMFGLVYHMESYLRRQKANGRSHWELAHTVVNPVKRLFKYLDKQVKLLSPSVCSLFNYQTITYAGCHHSYRCRKARAHFAYRPPVGLRDALLQTAIHFHLKELDEAYLIAKEPEVGLFYGCWHKFLNECMRCLRLLPGIFIWSFKKIRQRIKSS